MSDESQPAAPDPFDADLLGVVCDKIEDDGFPAWVADWVRGKVAEEQQYRNLRRARESWDEMQRRLLDRPGDPGAYPDAMMSRDWNPSRTFVNSADYYSISANLPASSHTLPIVAVDPSVPPGTVMARDADGRYRAYMDIDLGDTGRGGDEGDGPPRKEGTTTP